jgi:predicted nucleic acid-binding protein
MIVCNSGPLIALGGIDQLELLRDLFGRVCVPAEVVAEWQHGGIQKIGVDALQRACWIDTASIPTFCDPLLASMLDVGEARAIELARLRQPATLLMDEARGRRVARDVYGLKVIGTGRVLVEAKRAGLIPQVAPLVSAIRASGYWLSDKIVAEILRQAGE